MPLCTTKCYSVLQSITPVLLRTTPYYSSPTKYYSSTTLHYQVLLRYYKALLQYYSVLQSITPYYKVLLQYYSVLPSTTPYYKVLLRYYKALLQYYSVLLQYYSVLHQQQYQQQQQHHQHQHQHQQHQHQISMLLQFRAIDTHDLTKGFHPAPENFNFTTVSCDRRARSYERVAPSTARSQFYYSFARSTSTSLRKGCTQHRKIAVLLQFRAIDASRCKIVKLLEFRAIDAYDLTKGLRQQVQNRQITTVSRDRHVGSYEKVTR